MRSSDHVEDNDVKLYMVGWYIDRLVLVVCTLALNFYRYIFVTFKSTTFESFLKIMESFGYDDANSVVLFSMKIINFSKTTVMLPCLDSANFDANSDWQED